MSDVFQELEEDIREEKYRTIWKRYRYYLISILVIIVLGVSINAYLNNQNEKEVNDRSEKFFNAIEASNEDSDNAIKLLGEFFDSEANNSEYNVVLSLFTEAALKREKQDFLGAISRYREIMLLDVESFYIDYANLSIAETSISLNKIDDSVLILENLINNSSSLTLIAKEYLAYIEIKRGNFSRSKNLFQEIYEDASASNAIKNRVKEVLSIF